MQAWFEFLKKQEIEIGKENVDQWLTPLKILKFDACNLYLEASSTFQVLWFKEHVTPHLKKNLLNANSKPIYVHLSLANDTQKKEKEKKEPPLSHIKIKPDTLDPSTTLSSFIAEEGNFLAYKLISELTGFNPETHDYQNPKLALSAFNPIFLHGPKSTGKTHLLMAAANGLQKQNLKVFFIRSETFTEHVVTAIRLAQMGEFRKAYREIDVLIIDDIHIFSRKNATQEEFFHTFNTLHNLGSQIIISADLPPHQLSHIEPRLISRFEWGISLPLTKITSSTLRQITLAQIKKLDLPLADIHIDFLLETFKNNIHLALDALALRFHLNHIHTPPELPTLKEFLQDLIEKEKEAAITPEKIVKTISEHFGIRDDDILGRSQTKDFTLPRQLAMYLCRQNLKMPFIKIGEFFDRDHSTVMTSIKQIQTALNEKDKNISFTLSEILLNLEKN